MFFIAFVDMTIENLSDLRVYCRRFKLKKKRSAFNDMGYDATLTN